jgi:biotin transport system substrate-specific component
MMNNSYAAMFRPAARGQALVYDFMLVIGATIAIALSAQLALPVPFSPVPITMQTLAVLLTGALLGSRLGALAILAYLFEGAAGLPVFANAHGGLVHLFGPTGGYLLGFVPAAGITGYLTERRGKTSWQITLLIMTVGTLVIFICGLGWLSFFTTGSELFFLGLYPYLPGAFFKIIIASLLYMSGWQVADLRKKH